VFSFEDCPDVSIPYTFSPYGTHRDQRLLLFIQTTAALGINDRVDETLRVTVELEITSQAADFFSQILSFLAYGGSSVVKTLNFDSFSHSADG
jgi:hypothetical protein